MGRHLLCIYLWLQMAHSLCKSGENWGFRVRVYCRSGVPDTNFKNADSGW